MKTPQVKEQSFFAIKNQINILCLNRRHFAIFAPMIRIAIVEDNNTLRQSLEQLFNRTDDLKCVASLGNLMNVVSDLSKAQPDIVLMDIGLPNISGIEGVRTIKTNF